MSDRHAAYRPNASHHPGAVARRSAGSRPNTALGAIASALVLATPIVGGVSDLSDVGGLAPIEAGEVAYRYSHVAATPASAATSMSAFRSHQSFRAIELTPALARVQDDGDAPVDQKPTLRFLDAGAMRLNVFGAYGTDFTDTHQGGAGLGVSWFIVERLSVDLELNGWGFAQEGSDAAGGNLNLLFRWHFHHEGDFTLYVDGGAGVMVTSDDVPSDGSSFNFTPQLGIGASWAVADDVHLLVGVRWFHISNARIYKDNPAQDNMLIYAGLSFVLP